MREREREREAIDIHSEEEKTILTLLFFVLNVNNISNRYVNVKAPKARTPYFSAQKVMKRQQGSCIFTLTFTFLSPEKTAILSH